MNQLYVSVLIQLARVVFVNLSPVILSSVRSELLNLQAKCLESPNEWDDVLAAAIGPLVSLIPDPRK